SSCECREDLDLKCIAYVNSGSCFSFYKGKQCQCPNPTTEYWTGTDCVSKNLQSSFCTTSCECREDLGLTCIAYVNSGSCFGFYNGKQCQCPNPSTQYWTGTACVSKINNGFQCGSDCQCFSNKCVYDYHGTVTLHNRCVL
ncbi:unnamed protein product, partial [Brachionus calyciflorus]